MIRSNRKWLLLSAVLIGLGSSGFVIGLVQNWMAEPEEVDLGPPLIATIGYGNIENSIAAAGTLAPGADSAPDGVEAEEGVASDRLTVVAEVFDNDVAAVDDAHQIYFTLPGGGDRRWRGDGLRVNPVPDMSLGIARYTVRFSVDNATGDLYPGMAAQVFFVVSSAEDVLTVPMGALTLGAASGNTRRATVEAVRPDGATERREVVVRAMDRVSAEVVSGLAEGDRVVAGRIIAPAEFFDRSGGFRGGRGRGGRREQFEERFFEPEPGVQ